MEVSGRIGPSDSIISCQPCQDDGDTVQAEGYCENCNQFICSSCIKAHRKLPVAKHHVIKSKDDMPKSPATQSDPCTELCDVHMNEIVKYYCKEHDSVGCGDCMVLEHTSCKVQLVSDVSSNYKESDELVLIKHKIDHLRKNLESCNEEIKHSLKTADEIKTNIIKEIKQFRDEIDAYLDKVTKDLIHEVETLSASDVSRQQKLHGQWKATAEEIEKMQKKLEECKDNVNDLFVSSKQVREQLQKCQDINEESSSKSQIYTFTFSPTEELNALKIENTRLGNFETEVKQFPGHCAKSITDMKAHFAQKICVKVKEELKCGIGGMTMISEDEILCADYDNMSLKVLNHKEGKITSVLKTSCHPINVTTINSTTAAATLYEEGKIVFLNTRNGLTVSHSIKVRKACCGIDHRNGIIAVCCVKPPTVRVIDMEGQILYKFRDKGILKNPEYVCLGNDAESIFVSDWENNAVYEFTLKGHLINTIKSQELAHPFGTTITNCGSVIVCDPNKSDRVAVIVPGAKDFFIYLLKIFINHYLSSFVKNKDKCLSVNFMKEKTTITLKCLI